MLMFDEVRDGGFKNDDVDNFFFLNPTFFLKKVNIFQNQSHKRIMKNAFEGPLFPFQGGFINEQERLHQLPF